MGERKFSDRILAIVVENGGLSIGRTLLLIIFALAMVQWCRGIDIPSSQINILMVLFGYVLGSKVVSNISGTVGKVMETKRVISDALNKK